MTIPLASLKVYIFNPAKKRKTHGCAHTQKTFVTCSLGNGVLPHIWSCIYGVLNPLPASPAKTTLPKERIPTSLYYTPSTVPSPEYIAWRIPGTGEPGGLLSMGSHRVGHD